MLRNRRKNTGRRNTHNGRNRNNVKSRNMDEESVITSDSSLDSLSSLSDFDIDESENSSEDSSESIPVISKKRSTRTKKQVKSKSTNRSNGVGKKLVYTFYCFSPVYG